MMASLLFVVLWSIVRLSGADSDRAKACFVKSQTSEPFSVLAALWLSAVAYAPAARHHGLVVQPLEAL